MTSIALKQHAKDNNATSTVTLFSGISGVFSSISRYYMRRSLRAQLRAMDSRQLDDIGIPAYKIDKFVKDSIN